MQILQQTFRVYVEIPELESCIKFYEKIQGTRCERRVRIPETEIEAAKVGGVLVPAGGEAMDKAAEIENLQCVIIRHRIGPNGWS